MKVLAIALGFSSLLVAAVQLAGHQKGLGNDIASWGEEGFRVACEAVVAFEKRRTEDETKRESGQEG